jgi:hypothetical protein
MTARRHSRFIEKLSYNCLSAKVIKMSNYLTMQLLLEYQKCELLSSTNTAW